MQVSNGTGQGSEYRVGTNSGGNMLRMISAENAENDVEPMEYSGGMLGPGENETFFTDASVHVEFWVDEKMVASAWFLKDPGQVMLVEKNGVFSIAVLGENSVAA
jgi:hypothetical protein